MPDILALSTRDYALALMTSLPDAGAERKPLLARTVSLPVADLPALIELLPFAAAAGELFSWVRRGEGMVGWGRAAEHVATGAERFASLRSWWESVAGGAIVRNEVGVPGTGPVAFGSIAYAASSAAAATLVVPQVVVGRRGDRAWLTTMTTGDELPSVIPPASS